MPRVCSKVHGATVSVRSTSTSEYFFALFVRSIKHIARLKHLFALETYPVLLHCDIDATDCQWAVDAQVPPVLVHQVKQQQPVDLRDRWAKLQM